MKDESFTKPLSDRCERRRMAFVAPYLLLLPEDAGQRTQSLREVFNGLRWIVRAGASWRMMPNDLPPWWVVYQQTKALDSRRLFYRSGGRFALVVAGSQRTQPAALGGYPG